MTVSLDWRAAGFIDLPMGVCNAQAVLLGEKVYMGGGDTTHGPTSDTLFIYDCTKRSWDQLDTPTQWYALTVYHGQLVLVGGVDPVNNSATKQLWTLDNGWWTQTLPPMLTERFRVSAVSTGDHLIVAGGDMGGESGVQDTVEVYDGQQQQWKKVQSLPKPCSWTKTAVHDGNWYLAGGEGQDGEVFYASLEHLTTTTYSKGDGQTSVWKTLPAPMSLKYSTPIAIREQLICVGGQSDGSDSSSSSAIFSYNFHTKTWADVGTLPAACHSTCALALPNEELLITEGMTERGMSSRVFRAKIE